MDSILTLKFLDHYHGLTNCRIKEFHSHNGYKKTPGKAGVFYRVSREVAA